MISPNRSERASPVPAADLPRPPRRPARPAPRRRTHLGRECSSDHHDDVRAPDRPERLLQRKLHVVEAVRTDIAGRPPALVPGDGTAWPGGALCPGWVFCSCQRRRASEPRDVASHPCEVRLAAGSDGRIWEWLVVRGLGGGRDLTAPVALRSYWERDLSGPGGRDESIRWVESLRNTRAPRGLPSRPRRRWIRIRHLLPRLTPA